MARHKVYILDFFHPAGLAYAEQNAEVVRWDDPRVANWREDAEGIVVRESKVTAADLAQAKKLKVISKQGIGVEALDLDAAKASGVAVCTTPGINSEATATMSFTLALAVARRVAQLDRMIRSGGPVQRGHYLGIDMLKKTVAIIGTGRVGMRVARMWHGAFEARILAVASSPDSRREGWETIPHERLASLAQALPQADVLSLHVPLTEATRTMIDAPQLAAMKKTAILVNTSRGEILNETALYEAIKNGTIFGAGLDTWNVEPPGADNPLMTLPTVVGTPHSASGTFDVQEQSALLVARQLLDVLDGKEAFFRNV